MQFTDDVLQVPLNVVSLRFYRDFNAVLGVLGLGGILVIFWRVWFLLGPEFMHPKTASDRDALPFVAVGVLCIVLCIGSTPWPLFQLTKVLTRTLKQNLPAIVVTREGIWDNSSNYVFGFIPWTEIADFMVTERSGSRGQTTYPGIAFVVKDKNVLLKRKPGLMGIWLGSDNEITGRRQVFIPQGRIDVPIEVVAPLIADFRRRLTQGNTEQALPNVRR